jgi:hypothetical protein
VDAVKDAVAVKQMMEELKESVHLPIKVDLKLFLLIKICK